MPKGRRRGISNRTQLLRTARHDHRGSYQYIATRPKVAIWLLPGFFLCQVVRFIGWHRRRRDQLVTSVQPIGSETLRADGHKRMCLAPLKHVRCEFGSVFVADGPSLKIRYAVSLYLERGCGGTGHIDERRPGKHSVLKWVVCIFLAVA